MAQKVMVQLVDDLDGTSSADISTVEFGLDGVEYEIDLNSTNAERIRKALVEYIESGRRTGGRLKRGVRPALSDSGEAARIREWAQQNGTELAARGRIPSHVVEAYKEAQAAAVAPKAKRAPAKRRAKATAG